MTESITQSKRVPSSAVRLHLHFAWWSLLCFLSVGIGLESLHAFKIGWYLEGDYEVRRLLWTLGHAHGTLLSLVHAIFAITIYLLPIETTRGRRMASPCLMGASLLLPGGFFLGGIFIYDGDPGIGIWLLPLGALLLFAAVLMTAVGTVTCTERGDGETPAEPRKNRGKGP